VTYNLWPLKLVLKLKLESRSTQRESLQNPKTKSSYDFELQT